jgi:signal transduction histidine kinase
MLERRETAVYAESTESLLRATIQPLEQNMMATTLRGDIALFTQVLDNLMRNAKEAAGPQGGVVIRARRGGPNAWIEIDDTGPGWPDSVSDKLFEPFISTKESGTGLGLAITLRIVEEVGGSIKCFRTKEGTPREVTRFQVSWP